MTLEEIISLDKKYYMNTFGDRAKAAFSHGEGVNLYTTDGRVFKDFLGGIAVNALGHHHPVLTAALHKQADKLLHVSNLYYNENQARLAAELVTRTCADRVFFCNSGAEANEGAIKLAKIYFYKKKINRYGIVSVNTSFHGRTLATVAATGQEKYQAPYRPLLEGFKQVAPNDFDALAAAVDEHTAAVLLEPVRGESGVHPLDNEYLNKVRKLCDEQGILLIFDEVQTGMGRTGKLFAYMNTEVEPDIFTSAKALGGGIPIGAVCAKKEVAAAFEPGDHGTTFGGNPFACAAGLAVFEAFDKENLVENAAEMGAYLKEKLEEIKKDSGAKITDVRARGLLIGIEFTPELAKKAFAGLFDEGYLTSLCGGVTIRIAPPLIITKEDADGFADALKKVVSSL